VYFDDDDFWLADGFRRYHAYRAVGVPEVLAKCAPALADAEWSAWTDVAADLLSKPP
jgi:hypothetical protein